MLGNAKSNKNIGLILSLFFICVLFLGIVYAGDAKADTETSPYWTGQSFGDAAKVGGITAGATGTTTYLMNSIIGTDTKTTTASTTYGTIGAGLLGAAGSLLCGPGCAMIGGGLGGLAGGLAGFFTTRNEVIKTVPRTVSFIAQYVSITDAIYLNQPLVKMKGTPVDVGDNKYKGSLENIISKYAPLDQNYLKADGSTKIAIYPIGFASIDAPEIQSGLLYIDYNKLDVNKLAGIPDINKKKVVGSLKYGDAGNQEKIAAKDNLIIKFLEQIVRSPSYLFNESASYALLFRNLAPSDMSFVLPNISCFKDDGTTGATGPEAKPRVLFKWGWDSLQRQEVYTNAEAYCNDHVDPEEVSNCISAQQNRRALYGEGPTACSAGYYCDSTQMMLEILNRLNSANDWLKSQKIDAGTSSVVATSFVSEIPDQAVPFKLSGTLGATAVSVSISPSAGVLTKDTTFNYRLYYLNTQTTEETLLTESSVILIPSGGTIKLIDDKTEKTLTALGLPVSTYQVKAIFETADGNKESYRMNSNIVDLALENVLSTSDELFKLDPDAQSEDCGRSNNACAAYNALHFKANMMADGFTTDFLNDFEYYALYGQFMQLPGNYAYEIASFMPDKIVFLPKSGAMSNPSGYVLNRAGTYNVNIVITYLHPVNQATVANAGAIFSDNNIAQNVDKIYVYLEPVSYNDNPLYYLPLNGTIGVVNSRIERNGYGVDFKGTGDVQFNNEQNDLLRISPSLTSDSTPLVHVELVKQENDLQTFNNTRRGDVLLVKRGTGVTAGTVTTGVEFYPSIPYRVALKWTKNTEGDGWAFYTVSSQNGPINTGNRFVVWSQYCNPSDITDYNNYDCAYFDGSLPIDHQRDNDILGAKSLYAPTGPFAGYSYGLELGKDQFIKGESTIIYMRGMMFMPQSYSGLSMTFPISASDAADLSEDGKTWGKTTTLESKNTAPQTIEDVYNMVEDGRLCVSGMDNSASVVFWWNPAKVFNPNYDITKSPAEQTNWNSVE